MKKGDFFLLSTIIICSILTTFYNFNVIPKNLAYDEILLAKLSLSLQNHKYIPFTHLADGHATVYFYIMLFCFKLFGINNFALRFPSAISGVLGVLVLYLILRLVFINKKLSFFPISFVSTMVFIFLRWRINFTRFSFEMPYLLLLELISTFFLFLSYKKKDFRLLMVSGIFAGLAFNSYQPGRIFFLLPLIFIVLMFKNIRAVLSFLVPFIILIVPMVTYMYLNKTSDIRVHELSYFSSSKIPSQKKLLYAVENTVKTTLMFAIRGDANGRHNFPFKPALNPVLNIFLIFGLVFFIASKKNQYSLYFILYFCIALVPAILTYPRDNPHMLRTYTAIVPVVYFIGSTIQKVTQITRNRFFHLGILIVLILSSLYELRTYFVYQSRVTKNSFEVTCSLDKVIKNEIKSFGDIPKECRVHKNMF